MTAGRGGGGEGTKQTLFIASLSIQFDSGNLFCRSQRMTEGATHSLGASLIGRAPVAVLQKCAAIESGVR